MKLVVQNISKSYNKIPILKNIDFSAYLGNKIILTGANGAGKTTLLKILASIVNPCNGTITFDHNSIINLHTYKKRIGWIPTTNNGLIQRLTGKENIVFFSNLLNISRDQIRSKEEIWHTTFPQFENILQTPFYKCSSGMKQLICIFCKTLHSPNLLILDEPFKNIDEQNRILLLKLLQNEYENKIIIFSSHHKGELQTFYNRELTLEDGILVS